MSRLPQRIDMFCSTINVGKERHVVDIHLVQRDQTIIAVFVRDFDFRESRIACLTTKMLLDEHLDVLLTRQFDEDGGLVDESVVGVTIRRNYGQILLKNLGWCWSKAQRRRESLVLQDCR